MSNGTYATLRPQRKRSSAWWGTIILILGTLAVLIFFPRASLLNRVSWLDSGICAQIATHSFYFGSNRLPLCARNTGIYLGFMVTLTTLYGKGRSKVQMIPRLPLLFVLLSGVIALAIDGGNSFLLDVGLPHIYQPNNYLRLATGLMTGLTMALLLVPLLNRLLWRDIHEGRSVTSWLELVQYFPMLVICFFAVASQHVSLLYPIALLSTSGVLIVLSSLNLIALVGVSRRDETFGRYRELVPFLGFALLLAIGELLVLAHLKLTLLQALGL